MPRENFRRSPGTDDAARLPVRTRRVLSGRAPLTSQSTVYCPRQETSVDAEECFTCRYFTGVVPHGRGAAIGCRGADEPGDLRDGPGADTTSVQAIMTRDVVCVAPETSLEGVIQLLVDRGYSGVPVVDKDGVPIGVVSKTDLVRAAHELEPYEREERTVRDIMMPIAFTLPEQATVAMVAAMMACESVHRVPLVDDRGRIVGIVSSLDVVRWLARISARQASFHALPSSG